LRSYGITGIMNTARLRGRSFDSHMGTQTSFFHLALVPATFQHPTVGTTLNSGDKFVELFLLRGQMSLACLSAGEPSAPLNEDACGLLVRRKIDMTRHANLIPNLSLAGQDSDAREAKRIEFAGLV
jgi:hypothetical protein